MAKKTKSRRKRTHIRAIFVAHSDTTTIESEKNTFELHTANECNTTNSFVSIESVCNAMDVGEMCSFQSGSYIYMLFLHLRPTPSNDVKTRNAMQQNVCSPFSMFASIKNAQRKHRTCWKVRRASRWWWKVVNAKTESSWSLDVRDARVSPRPSNVCNNAAERPVEKMYSEKTRRRWRSKSREERRTQSIKMFRENWLFSFEKHIYLCTYTCMSMSLAQQTQLPVWVCECGAEHMCERDLTVLIHYLNGIDTLPSRLWAPWSVWVREHRYICVDCRRRRPTLRLLALQS